MRIVLVIVAILCFAAASVGVAAPLALVPLGLGFWAASTLTP